MVESMLCAAWGSLLYVHTHILVVWTLCFHAQSVPVLRLGAEKCLKRLFFIFECERTLLACRFARVSSPLCNGAADGCFVLLADCRSALLCSCWVCKWSDEMWYFYCVQDLPNAMNAADITDKLGLHSLRQRNWYIQATCATSGEGLYEGLDWLSGQLAKKG